MTKLITQTSLSIFSVSDWEQNSQYLLRLVKAKWSFSSLCFPNQVGFIQSYSLCSTKFLLFFTVTKCCWQNSATCPLTVSLSFLFLIPDFLFLEAWFPFFKFFFLMQWFTWSPQVQLRHQLSLLFPSYYSSQPASFHHVTFVHCSSSVPVIFSCF